jgi:hypothetical protein
LHWDNGAAIEATRGATVDYIEKHFWIHCTADLRGYSIFGDYEAMVEGKVEPKLAWVVCMLREVIFSLGRVVVNTAESVIGTEAVTQGNVDKSVVKMLKEKATAVIGVVQQSFTIFTLNGCSLLGRGHHWNEDDRMWGRFIAATKWDELMTLLAIANYEAVIFHHTMHPFDYDWMATMVSDPKSVMRSRVNGVAARRLGTLPAGTTALGLFRPLLDEIAVRNQKVAEVIRPLEKTVNEFIRRVRARPLDYCVNLARAATATNLEQIGKVEPIIAVMYGYLIKLEVKKATAIQAKSLKNIAQRHGPAFALGQTLGEIVPATDKTPTEVLGELAALVGQVSTDWL